MFPFKFLTLLFILTISIIDAESKSCLLPNISYTICSSYNTNITIQSKSFTTIDFINECHEDFIEKIFNVSCHDSQELLSKRKKLTVAESYGYGFLAVFIISILSVGGLLVFPILYSKSFKYVLNLFIALAVGTLVGDTMFHLIPFALGIHGHSHNNENTHSSFSAPDYVWKMLVSVLILHGFYVLEIFFHTCIHPKHKHTNLVGNGDVIPYHDHIHVNEEICDLTPMNTDVELEHDHQLHNHTYHNLHQHIPNEKNTLLMANQVNDTNNNSNDSKCISCVHANENLTMNSLVSNELRKDSSKTNGYTPISMLTIDSKKNNDVESTNGFISKSKPLNSMGWMVLIGDGIHNFADGLAIGAAFSQDLVLGITTTLAIGLHELPHEFGDYAILIQSGFTHSRAIFFNFLSATTAFIGFFIGITLSSNEHIRQWIFSITIGMFIYIALVDLLPTLLNDEEMNFKRFIVVNIGILLGIAIMFVLALFEDRLIRSSR